jgi:multidrug efflux system outer membrane protein
MEEPTKEVDISMIYHKRLGALFAVAAMWVGSRTASAQAPEPGSGSAAGGPTVAHPAVDDPVLAPPPRAPSEVRSWDEALALIRHSPDYLTSAAGIERALAQHRIALAAVLPTLTGAGGYTHNFRQVSIPFGTETLVVPPANVWTAGASVQWNIIDPRGLYQLGTADLATEVARLSLDDRKRVIASSVVSAMLSTLAAERVAELDRVGLRAALERLVLTQTRLKFARGTDLDVDRAQQDIAAARAQLINGDESLRQSREALGQVLGSATPLSAPADLDLEGFERAVSTTCHVAPTIEHRADVAAATERVAIAQRQITDAKLRFAPTVGVGSQLEYASEATLAPNTTWNFGATLTLPLYDGGARYGAIRDANAVAEQARDALTTLRVDAMIEAARATRAVDVDTQARDVAKQQRDLSQRIDERTRNGYASGLGTSLDLVISAQALRSAEINLVLLDFQLAEARAGAVLVNAECVY